ncbi:hypothetical protein LEL_05830 [Akanthomyces lecanii RCEF 1005]|uniref:Uncharacterized protein n=1 Tax=Akanthomyces lecanii RCEF 1005 TaxID=1081108 RepID=A0A168G7Y7_CORDF|nr:hypothetical protein LEL_05830 [Akanthomyces lecanii RCEF 1005]
MSSTTGQTPPPAKSDEVSDTGESLQVLGTLEEEAQDQTYMSDGGCDELADASELNETAVSLPEAAPAPASTPAAPSGATTAESTEASWDSRSPEHSSGQLLDYPMYHADAQQTAVAGQLDFAAPPLEGSPFSFAAATPTLANWSVAQSWSTNYTHIRYSNADGNHQEGNSHILEWSRQISGTVLAAGLGPAALLDPAAMHLDPNFHFEAATNSAMEPLGSFGLNNEAATPGTEYVNMPNEDVESPGNVAALPLDMWSPVDLPEPILPPGVQVWQNRRFAHVFYMTFPQA